MSTTSTHYDKYKHRRHMEKSSKESRQSVERIKFHHEHSEKWSNNRIKNELSSLIAEFSYITDVPVKVSKNNHPKSALPSYHVYAANTNSARRGPFRRSSYSDDEIETEAKVHMKTVEWEDDNETRRSPPMRSPKNSIIRSRKSKPAHDKSLKKSRSKSKMTLLKKDKSNKSSRSPSRTKNKSPKRINHLKPRKSRSCSGKCPNKPPRVLSSQRIEHVPRKSRSSRGPRRKLSRSQPDAKVIKSRSHITEFCVATNDSLEKSGPRKKTCISQSEVETVKRRSNPIRRRKRSRSGSSVRYWPLRCDRSMDKKVEKRRPRQRICIKKSEEVVKKRSNPIRCRKKSRSGSLVRYWPLRCERSKKVEKRRPRRRICTSESEDEVFEKRSFPIRHSKRSGSSVRYWPLKCDRRKEEKVIVKRRQSIPILRKYEIKETIPSEDTTTITIYPKAPPKIPELPLNPEFLTDSTLPCKCFQCMRKYNLFVKLPKEHCTVGENPCFFNRKKIPEDPWQNIHGKCTFHFGPCTIQPTGFRQQEEAMGLYKKLPYPHHNNVMKGCCQKPIEWMGETESGYTSTPSVKSVFFKFNCYTHHIDSPIKQYFHSILGQTNFY